MKELDNANAPQRRKRDAPVNPPDTQEDSREEKLDDAEFGRRQAIPGIDPDANAGSDYDAMPDEDDAPLAEAPPARLSIPNSVFRPARILVNPRCVTTYAGVSHTQLALDLFGPERDGDAAGAGIGGVGKYVLEDWEGAPESFVCQDQRCVFCHSTLMAVY